MAQQQRQTKQGEPLFRALKWGAAAVSAAALCLLLVILTAAGVTKIPGQEQTSAGYKRNQAVYIPMRDGVRIAVDIWLPANLQAGQKAPSILHITRYQRAQHVGLLQRAFIGLRLTAKTELPNFQTQIFNDAGYVFIAVDARGSGASFGSREIEMSPDEVADYGEIADWVARQDWSDGNVGAIGVSYRGTAAELLASTGSPAVKAVAPLYSDFDPQFGLVQPGGAPSTFLEAWGDTISKMDRNDICGLNDKSGVMCVVQKLWSSGVKPVDGSSGHALLKQALKEHENNADVAIGIKTVEYRDDTFGATHFTTADVSPYGYKDKIESSGIPFHVRVGWLDAATTDGALSRYRTFSNPQELIIGPYSHGGRTDIDPFSDADAPASPPVADQWKDMVSFFDQAFSRNGPQTSEKIIRYYTMGAGKWRETRTWPPQGLANQKWYFGDEGGLMTKPPSTTAPSDRYIVDRDVSSGPQTRWHTNLGWGDVVYADRRRQTDRLLTYTSPPLMSDLEITGTAILNFYVASTTPDNVFHAYLEAVTPEGEVLYLTEGVLRGMHRNISEAEPVYVHDGPHHSFLKRDAAETRPGEIMEISIGLYATSVVVPEGYQVRISLAGADRSIFKPLPEEITPEWTVYRNATHPSHLILPARDWTQ